MSSVAPSIESESFQSYAELVRRLLPGTGDVAFVAADGTISWTRSTWMLTDERLLDRLRTCLREGAGTQIIDPANVLVLVPIMSGNLLCGAILLAAELQARESTEAATARITRALEPVVGCLARELARSAPRPSRADVLTERTEELEWLFAITADLNSAGSETAAVEHLLAAAVERMEASFGALAIPEKRLELTYASRTHADPGASAAYQQAHTHLMSFIQRRGTTLLANKPPRVAGNPLGRKILAVPVARQSGECLGFAAFFKPASLADFGRRQIYLARHIARQIAALLESQYDLATGLLTRAALESEVTRQIGMYSPETPHALAYFDLDNLHIVNETFGFDVGDEVIVRFADLLQTPLLRGSALTGRIAGDRFVVFLPTFDAVQTLQWSHAVQEELAKLTVGPANQRILLTVSCGIARLPHMEAPFSRALAAAELACRTAKERGRNRSEVYLDIDDSMMRRHSDILSVVRLRAALEKDRLQLFAQRIAPIHDMSLTSHLECLVRLIAEDGEIIPPADFMSAAQRYQLLQTIDEWVIRHALDALHPYATFLMRNQIGVSLNISGQSLGDEAFLLKVEDWVRRSGVAPGLITFEITETAAVTHLATTDTLMRRLRKLGCHFALDDFGTGVNSLAYLKSLKVDCVKIDGSFVRDLLSNPSSEAMVRAVVQLAKAHHIDCIAEYVERPAIAAKLGQLGVHYGQGHCIHEAEPLSTLLEALRAAESQRLRRQYLEEL